MDKRSFGEEKKDDCKTLLNALNRGQILFKVPRNPNQNLVILKKERNKKGDEGYVIGRHA